MVPVPITYSYWAGKMSQWVMVLATKPDDADSMPRTHLVETIDSASCPLTSLDMCTMASTHPHNYTHNQI